MAEEQDNWDGLEEEDKLDDSSLDSFFEDLSSIDEPYSNEESPNTLDQSFLENNNTPQPVKAQPPAKKRRWILPLLVLIVVGAGAWWFLHTPTADKANKQLFPASDIDLVNKDQLPKFNIEPPQEKTKSIVFKPSVTASSHQYYVQVAICSFDSCTKQFSNKLRRLQEPVYYKNKKDSFDFIVVITRKVMDYETANLVVDKINRINKLTGHASIVALTSGYRVTMGTFTALDRAKELKNYLEKITAATDKDMIQFSLERSQKAYTTTKVLAGPYVSRDQALNVVRKLRNNKFKGIFITKL